MACSKQAGPRAYLNYIETVAGVTVSQDEWHELRELARAEAVRDEFDRLKDDSPHESGLYSLAMDNVKPLVGRGRVDRDEAMSAADALARRIEKDGAATEAGDDREEFMANAAEQMQFDADDANVTRGTVAIVRYISDKGLDVSLRAARLRLKEKAQHRGEKRDVLKAADSESDPKLVEGLTRAASLMSDNGDFEVVKWSLSGDMEKEYPGLWEKYQTVVRGPQEARAFSMYSRAGNEASLAAARGIQERILEGGLKRSDIVTETHKAMDAVAVKHPEVWDTEPRTEFYRAANEAAREMGMDDIFE